MTSTTALRFQITLLGIRPPIWRRIEVRDDPTFRALHCAIQVVPEAKESRPEGIGAPACLGGRRACSPEDIGGASGCETLVAFLSGYFEESALMHDREACEYFRDCDPAHFDPRAIVFTDPANRLRELRET